MFQRTLRALLCFSLVISSACGPQSLMSVVTNIGAMKAPPPPQMKKISAVYNGPLSITIDPAIAAKQSGFKTQNLANRFRITSQSEGSGNGQGNGNNGSNGNGSGNDNGGHGDNEPSTAPHQNPKWKLNHPTNDQHGQDTQGTYFDPSDVSSLSGIQVDPKLGEVQAVGIDRSYAVTSIGAPSNPGSPVEFSSGKLTVVPKSDAALQQIMSLVGGQVLGAVATDGVEIQIDNSKVNLGKLPDYLRGASQYFEEPITSAGFSSLNMAYTYTAYMQLFAEHQDLFNALNIDRVGQSPTTSLTYDTAEGASMNTADRPRWAGYLADHRVREAWQYSVGTNVTVGWVDRGFYTDNDDPIEKHRDLNRTFLVDKGTTFGLPSGLNWHTPALDEYLNPVSSLDSRCHAAGACMVGFGGINNHAGGFGVAPNAKVIPIYAINSNDAAKAIQYAADNGAEVIGVNLDFIEDGARLRSAQFKYDILTYTITQMTVRAIPVVAPAGNWLPNKASPSYQQAKTVGGTSFDDTPFKRQRDIVDSMWSYTDAFVVGAANASKQVSDFSNYGGGVTGIAVWCSGRPSIDVYGDTVNHPSDQLQSPTGTSYSTPYACAAIALVKSVAKRAGFLPSVAMFKQLMRNNQSSIDGPVRIYDPATDSIKYQSGAHLGYYLDAEKLVTDMLALNGRTASQFQQQTVTGIMTNVRQANNEETADLLQGTSLFAGALGPVSVPALSSQQSDSRTFTMPGGRKLTYVSVSCWPSGPSGHLDVYKVGAQSMPAPTGTISPTTTNEGQSTTFTVTGSYLFPPLTLKLNGQAIATDPTGNASFQSGTFQSGPLPAGTYSATVQDGRGSSVILPLVTINATHNQATDRWLARIYRTDDASEIRVNYVVVNGQALYGCVFNAAPGQDIYLDVTNFIQNGNNTIELQTINVSGTSSWGFEVRQVNSQFPSPGYQVRLKEESPPNRTDTSTGTVFFKTYTFPVSNNTHGNDAAICPQITNQGWN